MIVTNKQPTPLEYLQPCAEVLSCSLEGIVCESNTEQIVDDGDEYVWD